MSRTRHRLPDNLTPQDSVCYPVFIPNDEQWIREFIRQVRTLTFDRHWERDEAYSALIVRDIWREMTYKPLIDAIANDEQCSDCDDDNLSSCFRLNTTTEAYQFYPNDPFGIGESETVALGMTWRRWENTDIENSPFFQYLEDQLSNALGYYPNDIIVFPTNLVDFALSNLAEFISLITFQTFPFPYASFDFIGSGDVTIELVNFPLGCSVLLIPDMDLSLSGLLDVIIDIFDNDGSFPDGWVFTEVNRDFLQIPPETAPTQGQSIDFLDDGEHSLHVIFIPRLNDELPFVFPFGGIREIQVCGDLEVVGYQTGETINKENAGLETHLRNGVVGMTTTDDQCEAFLCALRKFYGGAVAGSASGLAYSIGDDGLPVYSTSTGQSDSTEYREILNGQAQGIVNGVNEYLQDYEDFRVSQASGVISSTTFMVAKWDVDETLQNDAITAYFTARDDVSPVDPVPAFPDTLTENLYCDGMTLATINAWIIDNSTYDKTLLLKMVKPLLDTQLDKWIAKGATQPRDSYLTYGCNRLPELSFTRTSITNDVYQTWGSVSQYAPTAERLVRVTTKGFFSDAEGRRQDACFYDDENGTRTVTPWDQFRLTVSGDFPTPIQPPTGLPFSETGEYSWIIELPNKNWNNFETLESNDWIGLATGEMTITFQDLGAQ